MGFQLPSSAGEFTGFLVAINSMAQFPQDGVFSPTRMSQEVRDQWWGSMGYLTYLKNGIYWGYKHLLLNIRNGWVIFLKCIVMGIDHCNHWSSCKPLRNWRWWVYPVKKMERMGVDRLHPDTHIDPNHSSSTSNGTCPRKLGSMDNYNPLINGISLGVKNATDPNLWSWLPPKMR